VSRPSITQLRRDDRGQSTAEYALVMLGAATVALMLITWASRTDKIGQLLDGVIDSILGQLT
jgi:Flp pilus assembly pilin Flp